MTVLLDPGNVAESFSDGLSRMWRATAGLWKGVYTTAEAARVAAVALAAQYNTDRNTAYDGGVWGSGNTWRTLANTAYDGAVWGVGTHWNSRWTTTEAARAAAVSHQAASGIGNHSISISDGSVAHDTWVNRATFTAPKNGNYVFYWDCMVGGKGGAYESGENAQLRIVGPWGTTTGRAAGVKPDNNTSDTSVSVWAIGYMGNGQTASFEAWFHNGVSSDGRSFFNSNCQIRFVPEYSYPS